MLDQLPLAKLFKTALRQGGDFADVFYEHTKETTISLDNKKVEKIVCGCDAGLGIRVVHSGKTAYGYTNDLGERSILELAGAVAQASKGCIWNRDLDFSKKRPRIPLRIRIRPDKIRLREKIKPINDANRLAWGIDKRMQQVSLTYRDTIRKVSIANSLDELVDDEKIDTVFLAVVVAADGGIIQTGIELIGGFAGFEFFEEHSPQDAVREASRRALLMLTARPAPTGSMPVVLSSEAGGTMIHEAVGHGLEADLALRGFSVYQNRMGEQVASPLVTVVDDATLPGKRGSYAFDDEGVHAQRTVLIENGVLRSYISDLLTAQLSGSPSTGNGRRSSFRFRPLVRMSNTILQPGSDEPDQIIKDTHQGLFVKKMGGGQVNTISGDFIFEVQEGYLISCGKIGEPVRGATLIGNGPEVLNRIDRVGNDLGFAIGTCGKDEQAVPVGDAQPTVRIPEMVVGGT